MPGIGGRKPFAFEDVAEVATTVFTEDLDPAAIGVAVFTDGAGDFVVEAGPAATAAEFVLAVIQRCIAPPANKYTVDFKIIKLIGERHLGAFVNDDVRFLGREGIVIFWSLHREETPAGIIWFKGLAKKPEKP
jgi:hypothetical protein